MILARAAWADSQRVCDGWSIPRELTPSEWTERNRVLTDRESSEPGPLKLDRTPYLRDILNDCANPDINEVTVMKAVQVGMSEAVRSVLGYWIDEDPGPTLIVMAREEDAREVLDERVRPMIETTPCLRKHLSDRKRAATKSRILLDNMDIHVGWATSAASLASRPRRYVWFDEADKYPEWTGKEADPISLGKERLTTYGHRAKAVIFSTPTTRMGPTFKAFDDCPVKKDYHLPCPHCGVMEPPSFTNITWPKDLPGSREVQAEIIENEMLAWYDCPHCHERIDERFKPTMLRLGRWIARPIMIEENATPHVLTSRRVAYHVSGLLSPWVSWSKIAAEWLRAQGDPKKLMNFRNSRLGEAYEVQTMTLKSEEFAAKVAAGHPPRLVPLWAGMLLATADTQKDHFYWTVRAWGFGWRSRLLAHGRVQTFDELRKQCLDTGFAWERPGLPLIYPNFLGIDSGGGMVDDDRSRTDDVYQFALSDAGRILAMKGHGGDREAQAPVRLATIKYSPPGERAPYEVSLYVLDTTYFKDVLARRIRQKPDDPDAWELHAEVDADYTKQMASERKVLIKTKRGGGVIRWVKVAEHAANHYWDCEAQQIALAQIAHVEQLPPLDVLEAERERALRARTANPTTGLQDPFGRPFSVIQR